MTTVFLTAGSGNWTVPAGVTTLTKVECIGGGQKGGLGASTANGGAGGSYAKITGLSVTPGSSIAYVVGGQGPTGGDLYFNGASIAASSVGAPGGGSASAAVGTTTFAGGTGAIGSGFKGGGGAAGPNGAGVNSSGSLGAGGQGDAGFGGAGSAGNGGSGGSAGTEFDASHGSGGGGGGDTNTPSNGGLYGAGGGSSSTANGVPGNGTAGLIVITYTAAAVATPFQRARDFEYLAI